MAVSPAAKRLQDRTLDYFNIQPGELRPTLGLAAYLLFGIASVISLKAAADSLFLEEFDPRRLPLVDLSITVLVAVVVGLYLRLSNRLPLGRLISGTQVFQDFRFGLGTATVYIRAGPNATSFRAEPCTSPPPVGARLVRPLTDVDCAA